MYAKKFQTATEQIKKRLQIVVFFRFARSLLEIFLAKFISDYFLFSPSFPENLVVFCCVLWTLKNKPFGI